LKEWEAALAETRLRVADIRAKYAGEVPSSPGPHPPVEKFPRIEDALALAMPWAENLYHEARAQLAQAEGRKLDALVYYQTILRAKPSSGEVDYSKMSEDPTIIAKADELWRQLGGTADTWQMWQTPQTPSASPSIDSLIFPADNNWLSTSHALIDFTLPDRNRRKWTLADIKGKTTFINVWATWCPSRREELPQVQALYDKLSGRKDVQVITLNTDDEKLLVEPFLKEYGYTFPVIYAKDLWDSLIVPTGGTSIPQCWISDSSGVIRLKLLDSDWPAEKWLRETLTAMDKVH
jgi:thiol-disulfide isomerase/thioredoxin